MLLTFFFFLLFTILSYEHVFCMFSLPRLKISVSTDISLLGFYGYIGDISVDIFI